MRHPHYAPSEVKRKPERTAKEIIRIYGVSLLKTKIPGERKENDLPPLQTNNRQLVSANLMAAALAEHLFVLWSFKAPRMDAETVAVLPYKFVANLSKLETYK